MAKANILIVDNDPHYRESLAKDVLEIEGYTVFQAANQRVAKRILTEQLVHLAIIDLRLRDDDDPNDTSGLILCEALEPFVARIILTGFPDVWEIVRQALSSTSQKRRLADSFLSKTEPQEIILTEIRRILGQEFEVIPERRIAVLTSGGDTPGMNAALWAIVHTALNNKLEVIGVEDGYEGLVCNRMKKLTWHEVDNARVQAGTILGTARFPDFENPAVRQKALANLINKQISGLIVIGGDGSMQGAAVLAKDLAQTDYRCQIVGLPGTIDNDVWGTDMSLGTASAANAIVEDLRHMIRPAQALRRIFIAEVPGRYCGYLALQAAVGIMADAVIIPEQVVEVSTSLRPEIAEIAEIEQTWQTCVEGDKTVDNFRAQLRKAAESLQCSFLNGKPYGFVILSEGISQLIGDTWDRKYVRGYLEDRIKFWTNGHRPQVREHVLGFPVRGVPPGRFDIWLGTTLGRAAVMRLLEKKTGVMVGRAGSQEITEMSFNEVLAKSNCPPKMAWQYRPLWQEILQSHQDLVRPLELNCHEATI